MRYFGKLEGHLYYFQQSEFEKMMDDFNLSTIYGLEYTAEMYKIDKYKIYTFKEFIEELDSKQKE